MLAIGAKTVQLGIGTGKTNINLYLFMFKACIISRSNGQPGQGIYSDVIALMASGRIDMRKMITWRINFEGIDDGFDQERGSVSGKILVSAGYPKK